MIETWYRVIFYIVIACSLLLSNITFAVPNIDGIQVYQKNMHLSEEHKQKLAEDIYRYNTADNMWEELRREFILPHYEDNFEVQEQLSWFLNHPDFLLHSATRAAPYLYYILQQVRLRHLPAELVLLPMIESAYNPFAYSSVGAAGIWQMMPSTASGFGIKQDWWYDGRRDVVASTRAALDFLSYLGNFFGGNWLLAIAAYDTGEGNVLSAIHKNIRDGRTTDFWSLPVAQETRIYIPRLLALAIIISHPEMYPIPWPPVPNAPYLAQIDIGGQIDLKNAAVIAGLSFVRLKQLNPGYNRSRTDPHGPFKLVLPIENVQQFTENLAHSTFYQKLTWLSYRIRHGDTLAGIAKRFKTTASAIRKANPRLAMNLKPGKHLRIPETAMSISNKILEPEQTHLASSQIHPTNPIPDQVIAQNQNTSTVNSTELAANKPQTPQPLSILASALENLHEKYKLQPGDTLYMVRNGDDLEKISYRFHLTEKTIQLANDMLDDQVHPGSKIIIPTHLVEQASRQQFQLTPGDTVYLVKKGDTVDSIADQFQTSPAAIRLANLLTNDSIQEGDRLVIPNHPATTG